MSKELLKKRTASIPARLVEKMNHLQKQVIIEYSSETKLKAVIRWRQRMAKAGIMVRDISKEIEKPESRVSEWLNFKKEPNEEMFLNIEKVIYKMGG